MHPLSEIRSFHRLAGVVSAGLGLALLAGCGSLARPSGAAMPAPPSAAAAKPAAGAVQPPGTDAAARAAAASVPQLQPLAPGTEQLVVSTRSLVAYAARLRLLSAAESAQEIGRLVGATDSLSRLKLALVLAQTHQGSDTSRALGLLQRVMAERDTPDTPEAAYWSAIAQLLQARLLEQRKLEEQLDRQAQQLRENDRSIERLNHKINALRAIERSLNTRPPAASGSATGGRSGPQP